MMNNNGDLAVTSPLQLELHSTSYQPSSTLRVRKLASTESDQLMLSIISSDRLGKLPKINSKNSSPKLAKIKEVSPKKQYKLLKITGVTPTRND